MTTLPRFDIVPLDGGWLLTDNGSLLRYFASSVGALEAAKAIADSAETPVQVFIRQDDDARLAYENEGSKRLRASA